MRRYYVYIMTNHRRTLYTGMTGNLVARVDQHKEALAPGFTQRYRIDQLVYFEEFDRAYDAIRREKQIKGWTRQRKIALIETVNPTWCDISSSWNQDMTSSTFADPPIPPDGQS